MWQRSRVYVKPTKRGRGPRYEPDKKKGWMTELTHEGAAMTNQKAEAQMNQKESPGDARPTAVDDKY